jgi:Ca2+-binding EF-hand superfamily protein
VRSLFRRFDPVMKGYIPALDLWGALVLASTCTATEKINFLFDLMDLDRDEHLSREDLAIIMRCSTRGFSNFKEILQVPLKTVNVMVEEAFSRETVELNEFGYIHVKDLRPYLLVDDKARTYFANLGTLIVVEDSSKLIEQREDLLKELAEVENELYELETSLQVTSDDADMYRSERGGDSHLVRLTEKLLVNSTKKGELSIFCEQRVGLYEMLQQMLTNQPLRSPSHSPTTGCPSK